MKNRGYPAALLVLAAVAVGGCGDATVSSEGGGFHNTPDTAGTQRRLNDLDQAIVGDRMAWTIRGWRAFRATQGGLTTCMAATGFKYAQVPFIASNDPSAPSVVDWSDAIAPPDLLAVTAPSGYVSWQAAQTLAQGGTSLNGEWPNPGYARLGAQERDRYDAALDACSANDPGAAYDQPSEAANELQSQLSQEVARAVSDVADIRSGLAEYPGCMAGQGFDVADVTQLRDYLTGRAVDAVTTDGLRAPQRASEAWQSYLSLEETAARADATCRTQMNAAAMSAIAPVIDAFASEHGDEIASAQAEWSSLNKKFGSQLLADLG